MSAKGKEYKLMVRIAGEIDKTFSNSVKSVKNEVGKMKKMTADETFSVLDQGFNKIESVGKKALNTIKRTAELAAVAVAGIGTAATNAGMEFEAAMSTVEAISGANSEQMDELTEKARELGRNSIYSASEVADAMQYMGMAGWKTEQILAGIDPVLNLATASGEDFAMVSDIVTDNLTAFNMTAEEAARMADVMAAAAMNSNTNVAKMGATFKYAGSVAGALDFTIEDVAIATGLMASSGVKANMAGTALRNIFTRMVKPTKDAQKAMDAFGLSITEIDPKTGEEKIKSLMDIMLQMRKNVTGKSQDEIKQLVAGLSGGGVEQLTAEEKKYYEALSEEELDALVLAEELSDAEKKAYEGMTQTEKAYYAAGLAGQRGMTGLLTILNASDEDFKKLTEAIYGSAGAAEYMANVKVDNLKGDLSILKNNVTDAGIELYDTFSTDLRGYVQGFTEFIRNNIKNIPKWVDEISAHLATFKRKASKFVEPVFNMIVGGFKWLVKNKSAVIGTIAGIGSALAVYKIGSTLTHAATGFMSFVEAANPATLIFTGIAAAIGTLTAAITAYNVRQQEMIDQNLADHFGNISLTMKDLEDVAQGIVDNGTMQKLRDELAAFDDLEILKSQIQDSFKEVNKLTWKVSIGFELSDDEQQTYKNAVETAGKAQEELAEDTAHAVSQIWDSNDPIGAKINQFYLDNMVEMQTLGKNLSDEVNRAFADNILDPEEMTAIAEIQSKMAEIQKSISMGEQEAKLALIEQDYAAGTRLDSESFQNLQSQLKEVLKENEEIFNEYYVKKYASLKAAYEAEGSDITEEQFKEQIKALNDEKATNIYEQRARALQFESDTVLKAYEKEISEYNKVKNEVLKKYMDPSLAADWDYDNMYSTGGLMLRDIEKEIVDALDPVSMNAVEQLVENMQERINQLFALSQARGLSEEAKANIESQIKDLKAQLAELVGFTDSDFKFQEADIYNSINKMLESGDLSEGEIYVAKEIKDFIERQGNGYISEAQEEIDASYDWTAQALKEKFKAGYDIETDLRLTINPTVEFGETPIVNMSDIRLYNAMNGIAHNARGGLVDKTQLSWLAENGPEMVIPLDGSSRAFELWEQASQFMNGSLLDRYDINAGGSSETTIEYSPVLQFYGEAPSKSDLDSALKTSQDEFEAMMEKYLKKQARLAF